MSHNYIKSANEIQLKKKIKQRKSEFKRKTMFYLTNSSSTRDRLHSVRMSSCSNWVKHWRTVSLSLSHCRRPFPATLSFLRPWEKHKEMFNMYTQHTQKSSLEAVALRLPKKIFTAGGPNKEMRLFADRHIYTHTRDILKHTHCKLPNHPQMSISKGELYYARQLALI